MPYNMIFRHDDAAAYKMWHTAKNLAPVEAREILSLTPHKLKKYRLDTLSHFCSELNITQ